MAEHALDAAQHRERECSVTHEDDSDHDLSTHVAMLHPDRIAVSAEPPLQLLHERHRTMTSTGAPEPDRQIALTLTDVERQREIEQRGREREELLRFRPLEHVPSDGVV